MTTSFPLLSRALDAAATPITFFFRDDDAGWADAKLFSLCDRFSTRAPLDLAVIPLAIGQEIASALIAHEGQLAFHQHGYAHRNHQATGKKSELSDDRPAAEIAAEIRTGHLGLRLLFGDRLDPIFTPPWNRCGTTAARLLIDAGMHVLSRDYGAAPFGIRGLVELPIGVDWVRRRADLDMALTAAATRSPVGVMLHHEVLDNNDLSALDALLDLLIAHHSARLAHMADVVREVVPA